MVRQAIAGALPPRRCYPPRAKPKLDAVAASIDAVLDEDRRAPRKQWHTARRVWRRILKEFPDAGVAESTVCNHVRERRRALGLVARGTFVPQSYAWGHEAQVDWYEAWADLGGERTKVQVFAMCAMASGAAFHRAYVHATQQAFLEAHERAFAYFDGVFRLLRHDSLAGEVHKILRRQRREETTRFVAFRSHWRFAAEFCTLGAGHEKGGVEGEGGYFRRNRLVPVPEAADLDAFNALLLEGCRGDEARGLGRAHRDGRCRHSRRARPPAGAGGGGVRPGWGRVPAGDKRGCTAVKTNLYSVPLRAVPARPRPRTRPRRAGAQARRVGRLEAVGAVARERALARLLRRVVGTAARAARPARGHPRHGGRGGTRPRPAAL